MLKIINVIRTNKQVAKVFQIFKYKIKNKNRLQIINLTC